jgi:hypothetical protein
MEALRKIRRIGAGEIQRIAGIKRHPADDGSILEILRCFDE